MARLTKTSIALRGAMALFGGYAVAAAWQGALARSLPMSRIDATTASTLFSFTLFAAAAIWTFAARTATRAAIGLAIAGTIAAASWWALR